MPFESVRRAMSSPRRFLDRRRPVVKRFVVADRSMEPTLVPGQGLVGVAGTSAAIGQIRALPHPTRPDFWLVKRVTAVLGDAMEVESDNRSVATTDSRSFGPVQIVGTYRIVVRVPVRWM